LKVRTYITNIGNRARLFTINLEGFYIKKNFWGILIIIVVSTNIINLLYVALTKHTVDINSLVMVAVITLLTFLIYPKLKRS